MQITHKAQLIILKQLLYKPKCRFRDLNNTGLDNNHFNFHLQKLVKDEILQKDAIYYSLTNKGLKIANRVETKKEKILKQPKVGVLVIPFKEEKGKTYVLVGKRLKDIKKGEISFYTEKVQYAESLEETARRCLKNETGLEADFKFAGVIHHKHFKENIPIEVALLNCFKATNIKDELKEKTKEAENYWVSLSHAQKIKTIYKETFKLLPTIINNKLFFKELIINE